MPSPHPREREKLDPWAAIQHEYPQETEVSREADDDGSAVDLKQVVANLGPAVRVLVNLVGIVYGSVCTYLFARGYFLEAYAPFGYDSESGPANLHLIPPTTPVVTVDGTVLLLGWAVAPPCWFLLESYLLAKSPISREGSKERRLLGVAWWLGMLIAMVVLAK